MDVLTNRFFISAHFKEVGCEIIERRYTFDEHQPAGIGAEVLRVKV
jgi:hypothetical protein